MSNVIYKLAVNQLSFGNCSFGILNELYKKNKTDFQIHDIGTPTLNSFDKIRADENFINWFNERRGNTLQSFDRKNDVQFKMWHINDSQESMCDKNVLYVWHETDTLTKTESNILNNQDHIIVANNYSKQVFEDHGVKVPISVIPVGFDSVHFNNNIKRKLPKETCSWLIAGKFEESRKRHVKSIRGWIKKYGNNPKHILNLSIHNSFFSPEDNNRVLHMIFEGKPKPYNVNVHPYLETLTEYNDLLNFTDIVIAMGNEGWDLPAFTCTALGKHAVLHNCAGISMWANENNATLVESTHKIPCYDNIFFKEGQEFNQGNFFDFDEQNYLDNLSVAYDKWQKNPMNIEGLKLAKEFTWEKTTDGILEIINKYQ